ncbi:hypothetical protein KEM54_000327 [Ascosphaera aggregata]|nr:hypothetical protein KEM54_000327 [Ascosphaera aggregata]
MSIRPCSVLRCNLADYHSGPILRQPWASRACHLLWRGGLIHNGVITRNARVYRSSHVCLRPYHSGGRPATQTDVDPLALDGGLQARDNEPGVTRGLALTSLNNLSKLEDGRSQTKVQCESQESALDLSAFAECAKSSDFMKTSAISAQEDHINFENIYRRGLRFRMRTDCYSWERDYCLLFQMTLDGQNLLPLLENSRVRSHLRRLQIYDNGADKPSERWVWTWEVLELLATNPERFFGHLDLINYHNHPTLNVLADCFLYLRAFHYSTWPPEVQLRYQLAVQQHLHYGNWLGRKTSGAAALIYLEFSKPERTGRAFHFIRLYGLQVGPSSDESAAIIRRFLLQGKLRSWPAMVQKLQYRLKRVGFGVDQEMCQKELEARLQTTNVRINYEWWETNFTALYETTAKTFSVNDAKVHRKRMIPCNAIKLPERSMDWPSTALRMISAFPREAVTFLEKSDEVPRYPFNMMSDCFLYLRAFHYDRFSRKQRKHFRRALLQCLCPSRWLSISPADTGVRLYLQFATPQQVHDAFAHLVQYNITVSMDTLLYFMAKFIRNKDSNSALQVLERITAAFSHDEVNIEKVKEHCCKLLMLATSEKTFEGSVWNTAVWSHILELGIIPNKHMSNIVLRAALKHQMKDLAWSVLDIMRDENLQPDSYTYVALFEDASLREDLEQLDVLIEEVGKTLLREKHITSKLLHVYLSHLFSRRYNRAERTQLLSRMIELYGNAHDFGPLVDLKLLKSNVLNSANSSRPPPSRHALVLLVSAYLRARADTADILETFNRFRQLVIAGHPAYCALAKSDYIYNAFLMALPVTQHLLTASVEIVRQMSEPLPETACISDENGVHPIEAIKPTVQTWTILLSHFAVQGDGHTVWSVRDFMREQGLEFNLVAWNTAIGIFAARKMIGDMETALRQMIADGIFPDRHTMNSISRLHNRDQVIRITNLIKELLTHEKPETDVKTTE